MNIALIILVVAAVAVVGYFFLSNWSPASGPTLVFKIVKQKNR
jgi:hypothetical protein